MTEAIRVLIVDDEALAREGIRSLLESEADVRVVHECANGLEAVDALRRGGVDVVLLDIQMPGLDGFEVLQAIPEAALPVVLFLTAYDQHALRAFEASAIDYVVKPFSDERFRAALSRARRQVHQRRIGEATAGLADLLSRLGSKAPGAAAGRSRDAGAVRYIDRIPVRSVGRVAYVRVADLIWINSADYYAELHTADGKKHLVRETLQRLESKLDPSRFVRVHRTAIVRLDCVAELRVDGAERHSVILRNGVVVPLGKARRDSLEHLLGQRHTD